MSPSSRIRAGVIYDLTNDDQLVIDLLGVSEPSDAPDDDPEAKEPSKPPVDSPTSTTQAPGCPTEEKDSKQGEVPSEAPMEMPELTSEEAALVMMRTQQTLGYAVSPEKMSHYEDVACAQRGLCNHNIYVTRGKNKLTVIPKISNQPSLATYDSESEESDLGIHANAEESDEDMEPDAGSSDSDPAGYKLTTQAYIEKEAR